jgi:hypothetical protein
LSRAYYYCRRCGKGCAPFDQQVGLTPRHLTPAAEEAISMAGLLTDSFAESAEKVLPTLSGLHPSESTVERTTEDAGARLGEWLGRGCTFGKTTPWSWHKDKKGRSVAYVSVDATGVRQQASGGGPAEGRMPYVAMVYNPPPEKEKTENAQKNRPVQPRSAAEKAADVMQVRYLSGLYSLSDLGLLLRRQAAQAGMDQADVWIGLSDAGNGLDDFLRTNFNRPDMVLILDFYHPAARLEELARLCHPGQKEHAEATAQQWCHELKHEGGEKRLQRLRGLVPPTSQTGKEKYEETVGYFSNHKARMNYPHYLEQGWHIGSGGVESGCKTVVGQRLKLAGMRWREYGTDNVCHLRAIFKSEKGQWQAFWARKANKCSKFYQQK